MPRTQRIIVTDGSVLVHEAPRKRRSQKAAAPQPVEPVTPLQADELQLEVAEAPELELEAAEAAQLEATEAFELELEAAEEAELELAGESDLSAALAAEPEVELEVELEAELEVEPEVEPEAAAPDFSAPSPGQATRSGEPPNGAGTLVLDSAVPGAPRTVTRSRRTPAPPPPGWAIEFGTGRLVPLHGFRGRMSYPSSDD